MAGRDIRREAVPAKVTAAAVLQAKMNAFLVFIFIAEFTCVDDVTGRTTVRCPPPYAAG